MTRPDASAEPPAGPTPRTPLALARSAGEWLTSRGVAGGRLDAELLLAAALGLGRLELYLQHDRPLTEPEIDRFREMVRRRGRREPVQYIVGSVGFREIELKTDARALIPRPETEVLAGAVLDWARARGAAASLRALDIGTGTGAIALSLLAEGGFGTVVATDTSDDALALAAENAAALGLADRIDLRRGPLYSPLAEGERFDAIVSNPPYVAEDERAALASEVLDWEPAGALFAGAGGLDVVEPIVHGAAGRLLGAGLLALEVGATQADRVAELIGGTGAFGPAAIIADLAGRPRIVTAVRD